MKYNLSLSLLLRTHRDASSFSWPPEGAVKQGANRKGTLELKFGPVQWTVAALRKALGQGLPSLYSKRD